MFQEGNIIYFDPFYFSNGNTAKPKYFIVLKKINSEFLIASLPTRKDYIPTNHEITSVCIELPENYFNCFVLSKNSIVTDCGRKFDFNTYLYGYEIFDIEIQKIQEIYPNEGSDYTIWGNMKLELFKELKECFKNSKIVKRKYKKLI